MAHSFSIQSPLPLGAGMILILEEPHLPSTLKGMEWGWPQLHSQEPQPRLILIKFSIHGQEPACSDNELCERLLATNVWQLWDERFVLLPCFSDHDLGLGLAIPGDKDAPHVLCCVVKILEQL